jgi:rhodanese-related sulfurtransferase/glyoxylase-like metal-dependent hydrolase (beta-lactamase superfamily II)
MEVLWFQHEGLGNSSYLVQVAAGKALVVDPDRRVRRYIEAAEQRGWQIVAALDTHIHADFVTGGLDLRALTGAELYWPKGAEVGFAHRGLVAGERLDVGDVEIEVRATPGHTPEHTSYVLRAPGPTALPHLFSGGALIAGGAARTDLLSPEMTEALTRAQFRTVHEAFADLPDETLLRPTHGAGSFCSAGAETTATTLGVERMRNPLMRRTDEDEFVKWWPTTFPAIPAYFSRMREMNKSGPRLVSEIPAPPQLSPKAFMAAAAAGATVVDVRPGEAYAAGHIEGALAIEYRDAFATWLGWLLPAEAQLLFVCDGMPLELVLEESLLVGYERFAGVLQGGMDAWISQGLPVRSLPMIGPQDTVPWLELGASPVDVREPDEFELGHVAGATHIPLGALAERAAELPAGRPLLTYCAMGFRSVTAASVLERLGIGPVVNLRGGYGAWRQAGRD